MENFNLIPVVYSDNELLTYLETMPEVGDVLSLSLGEDGELEYLRVLEVTDKVVVGFF